MKYRTLLIEDCLHAAGFRTECHGGEVQVHVPVYRKLANGDAVIDSWELREIREVSQALEFLSSHQA